MASVNVGTAISTIALLGAATTAAGQYAELTWFVDDICGNSDRESFVYNGMQSWEDMGGDGVVDFSTCASVDDPHADPNATTYVKYECVDNVVSMTNFSEAGCTTEVATTTPNSNCTDGMALECATTAEELGVTVAEEWVAETTFYQDWPCINVTGNATNHTLGEIMALNTGQNETCLEEDGAYWTMGCIKGSFLWMFYPSDNNGCSGEWAGVNKAGTNCSQLAGDDAGYATFACTAIGNESERESEDGHDDHDDHDSDDPGEISGSPFAGMLLFTAGQLSVAMMAVAMMTNAAAAVFS